MRAALQGRRGGWNKKKIVFKLQLETYPLAGSLVGQQADGPPAQGLPLPLGGEDAQLLALLVAQRVAVTHLQQTRRRWKVGLLYS